MEFEPIVSPLFAWIFGIGICVVLIVQVIRIQQSDFSPLRKRVKQVLNVILFLSLLIFLLNPVWNSEPSSRPALLVSEEVGKSELDFWKENLGVEKSISADKYQQNFDSLILLGKGFSKEFLYSLRAKSVNWIIPNSENSPTFLQWKGVLRQGELQKIQLSQKLKSGSKLSISQAGNELKNYEFDADRSEFEIEMSASILGRNEWEILLDEESLGTIRFFVLPTPTLTFQIQVGYPGPEVRTLSRYLIGKGEEVQEEIQLSKHTELRTNNQPLDSVEVFIIDPSQISNSKIQKQVDRGVSIFLLNLREPEKEIKVLNKALGTDFEIVATKDEGNRFLENGLEVFPFELKAKPMQKLLMENSIAVQQIGSSKVGLSLLSSTFSLSQSGDSLAYSKFWDQILAELRPEATANWKLDSPIFQNQFFSIEYNGTDTVNRLKLNSENLSVKQSLVNPNSKILEGLYQDSGWQKIGGAVEVYSTPAEDWPLIFAHQERAKFLQSKVWLSSTSARYEIKNPIPFWLWGMIFSLVFTLIWLEPKINS